MGESPERPQSLLASPDTSLPGLTRQCRAACSEPVALDARLKAGHDDSSEGGGERPWNRPHTLGEAFLAAARGFREAGIETPELDARLLLCRAAGLSCEAYVARGDDPLLPDAALRFGTYVERRLAGEPVSRIVGVREFYGRPFRVDAGALDPRPDTETLIEAAIALADHERPLKILDLGTGSGCILVTLLAELPRARGVGVDISPLTVALARDNANSLGVGDRASFLVSDWLEAVEGLFDLVVANPPYLSSADMAGLAREVRDHDPRLALDGGRDGLSAYRRIVPHLGKVLGPGGIALLEIGPDQAPAVSRLLIEAGLALEAGKHLWRDLAGRPRVVGARAQG
jgi:release factor glutamine methyltransferase